MAQTAPLTLADRVEHLVESLHPVPPEKIAKLATNPHQRAKIVEILAAVAKIDKQGNIVPKPKLQPAAQAVHTIIHQHPNKQMQPDMLALYFDTQSEKQKVALTDAVHKVAQLVRDPSGKTLLRLRPGTDSPSPTNSSTMNDNESPCEVSIYENPSHKPHQFTETAVRNIISASPLGRMRTDMLLKHISPSTEHERRQLATAVASTARIISIRDEGGALIPHFVLRECISTNASKSNTFSSMQSCPSQKSSSAIASTLPMMSASSNRVSTSCTKKRITAAVVRSELLSTGGRMSSRELIDRFEPLGSLERSRLIEVVKEIADVHMSSPQGTKEIGIVTLKGIQPSSQLVASDVRPRSSSASTDEICTEPVVSRNEEERPEETEHFHPVDTRGVDTQQVLTNTADTSRANEASDDEWSLPGLQVESMCTSDVKEQITREQELYSKPSDSQSYDMRAEIKRKLQARKLRNSNISTPPSDSSASASRCALEAESEARSLLASLR